MNSHEHTEVPIYEASPERKERGRVPENYIRGAPKEPRDQSQFFKAVKAGKETRMNKDLQKNKADALNAYKAAKAAYLEDMNNQNWIAFCDAKTNCMRLGIRI